MKSISMQHMFFDLYPQKTGHFHKKRKNTKSYAFADDISSAQESSEHIYCEQIFIYLLVRNNTMNRKCIGDIHS